MNSKNKLLTVFGIVIILGGLSFAIIPHLELNFANKENIQSQQYTSEMIINTIEKEIPTEYKSNGYDVVAVKADSGVYDVGIALSTNDARFTYEAQCGVTGFDLINNLKSAYPSMDKQINKYHLTFFANSSRTYTATCYNDDSDSTEDAIKLIIMDNGVLMEEKTYEEYLAELQSTEMIISTIKEEIPTEYKSSGYDVVALKADNGAYNVGIGLSTDDARFTYEAQCGVAGFDLINNLKSAYPSMDKQINEYHLVFFANSSRTYTATCYNDDSDSPENAIKLKIMDNDSGVLMEEKTYEEYLAELESENENQAQTDTAEDDNEEDEELSYTERFYDGGLLIILPSSEKYNYRNENSTLYQYEHDYCLRYFELDSVKMSASKTEAIVFLTFKNTSTLDYSDVYVYCDYMDKNDIVIYQSIDSLDNVQSGRIYAMELSKYYGSDGKIPVSFRITKISFYFQSGDGNSITFD